MAKKGQYIYEYPHPAVTADCVIFGYDGKELKVLLIKRGKEKEASTTAYVGEWALPGGFLDVEKDTIPPPFSSKAILFCPFDLLFQLSRAPTAEINVGSSAPSDRRC